MLHETGLAAGGREGALAEDKRQVAESPSPSVLPPGTPSFCSRGASQGGLCQGDAGGLAWESVLTPLSPPSGIRTPGSSRPRREFGRQLLHSLLRSREPSGPLTSRPELLSSFSGSSAASLQSCERVLVQVCLSHCAFHPPAAPAVRTLGSSGLGNCLGLSSLPVGPALSGCSDAGPHLTGPLISFFLPSSLFRPPRLILLPTSRGLRGGCRVSTLKGQTTS